MNTSPTQIQRSAAQLQSVAIKALHRTPARGARRVPLFYPRTVVHTGGVSIGGLYDEVFKQRQYESPKHLPDRPRIVDAGAHLGLASLFFLTRYPGAVLTSIEPNPNLAPLLRANVKRWEHRATVLEAALSTHSGAAEFSITSDNPYNVTGGLENREEQSRAVVRHRVECVAAQDVLKEPVDLMKLDVEGHEYDLLELDLFRPEHIACLVVEFHDLRERREVFRRTLGFLVDERGYRLCDTRNAPVERTKLEASSDCVVLKLY